MEKHGAACLKPATSNPARPQGRGRHLLGWGQDSHAAMPGRERCHTLLCQTGMGVTHCHVMQGLVSPTAVPNRYGFHLLLCQAGLDVSCCRARQGQQTAMVVLLTDCSLHRDPGKMTA